MDPRIPPAQKVQMADTDEALESTVASPDKIDINALPNRVAERAADLSTPVRKSIALFLLLACAASIVGAILFVVLFLTR
jgi:hypothetical protein